LKKMALPGLAFVALILLFGCSQVQGDTTVCNPPYIRFEQGCCLDGNTNTICDEHEDAQTVPDEQTEQVPTKIDISTVTLEDLKIDLEQNFKYDDIVFSDVQYSDVIIKKESDAGIEEAVGAEILDTKDGGASGIMIYKTNNIGYTKNLLISDVYPEFFNMQTKKEVLSIKGVELIHIYGGDTEQSMFESFYIFSIGDYLFAVSSVTEESRYQPWLRDIASDFVSKYE